MNRQRKIQIQIWRLFRNGPDWGRAAMFGSFILLLILLLPPVRQLTYRYEVGKQWREKTLYAPFDFSIQKSEEEYRLDVEAALSQVYPVLAKDDSSWNAGQVQVRGLLLSMVANSGSYHAAVARKDTATANRIFRTYFRPYFPWLVAIPKPDGLTDMYLSRYREARAVQLGEKVFVSSSWNDNTFTPAPYVTLRTRPGEERYFSTASLIVGKKGIAGFIAKNPLPTSLSPAWQRLADSLIVNRFLPNYTFDAAQTQEAREMVKSQVSHVKEMVSKGSEIIGKNELVSIQDDLVIQSLEKELEAQYGQHNFWLMQLGRLVLVIMITTLLVMYLKANRPQIYNNKLKLGLILFVFLLVISTLALATRLSEYDFGDNMQRSWASLPFIYLAPACIIPIFISNFFGPRTGFICNILISLYGAVLVDNSLEYAFVQLMAGSVAVYSLRRLRKREMFFFSLGYIFLTYSIAYLSFNLFLKGNLADLKYGVLVLMGINVGITIIAYNLIYLLEQVFGVTSDLTYLELLDMNHPIMKELAKKAPGTFQHSIQVAHLAEATINEIGGNALLVHVGAMYHDIGKMVNPKYFIENLGDDEKAESPHSQIGCEESASMIIAHVRKGVELAHRHHLPREITDFIETHHGMTRVEFFYRKHLKELNCEIAEDEALYRYPGPLPFTKETAVVMICDSIEAASRAMKQPTQEKLKELVNSVIDHKIRDNQLENSSLTFKDIATIRRTVLRQLLTIYNNRIEYPKEALAVEGE